MPLLTVHENNNAAKSQPISFLYPETSERKMPDMQSYYEIILPDRLPERKEGEVNNIKKKAENISN